MTHDSPEMRMWDRVSEDQICTCIPCTTPANGAPGFPHCAACCYGTLIAEYSFDCPFPDHREWAARQFPGGPVSRRKEL